MPRFLFLLYLAGANLLANTTPARACSWEWSSEELLAKASAVFVARVVGTHEVAGTIEATFRLIEVLKGQPPTDAKVKDLACAAGNCSVCLVAATDYLSFLYKDNDVHLPGGSRPIVLHGVGREANETRELLRRLRPLSRQGK
jgi:hypothetical protein